jgi:hypothetical protein
MQLSFVPQKYKLPSTDILCGAFSWLSLGIIIFVA